MSVIAEEISLEKLCEKSQFIIVGKLKKNKAGENTVDHYEVVEILKDSHLKGVDSLKLKQILQVRDANEELMAGVSDQMKHNLIVPMPTIKSYKPSIDKTPGMMIVFLSMNSNKEYSYTTDRSWEAIARKSEIIKFLTQTK